MDRPDRRQPQAFPYERLINGFVAVVVMGVLAYAGSSLVKFNENQGSLATKEDVSRLKDALGDIRNELTGLKVGQVFEQREVRDRLADHTRQIEALRNRPGYPSPN